MSFMKQLKTSTQIALKFTIYFFVIFSVLWITTNGIFFTQRTTNEYNRVKWKQVIMEDPLNNHKWVWWKFKNIANVTSPIITLQYLEDIEQELKNNNITDNISHIDWSYIMYSIWDREIKLMDVSRPVEMQLNLLWNTIFIVLFWTLITFAISSRFARSSLEKINELVSYTKQLDIHNLTRKVPISWPEDDEIRIIASSFQKSLDIIKEQTDSLKDFVSYASHELKTPLSTIRGLIDLGVKTKDIEKTGPKIKKTLTEMSDLLDSLLLITKREFSDINKEEINIVPVIQQVGEQLKIQYQDKKISYNEQLPEEYTVSWKHDIIKIITSNILNNAYKFTPDWGKITITLEKNILIIEDTGIGMSSEDIEKIRTRFWKKSTEHNNWYWLGLYMVKLLVEKLWRKIQVESKKDKGTVFTIYMI